MVGPGSRRLQYCMHSGLQSFTVFFIHFTPRFFHTVSLSTLSIFSSNLRMGNGLNIRLSKWWSLGQQSFAKTQKPLKLSPLWRIFSVNKLFFSFEIHCIRKFGALSPSQAQCAHLHQSRTLLVSILHISTHCLIIIFNSICTCHSWATGIRKNTVALRDSESIPECLRALKAARAARSSCDALKDWWLQV